VDRPSWGPPEVDLYRPSTARIYDYLLGGSHNFAVDRDLAEQMLAATPEARQAAHANRAFLRRAIDYLTAAGIRQFIDLGSGIPTVGNVHEAARRVAPDARVVYVDHDPVAVSHSREIVAGDTQVAVVQADIRAPETVVNHPQVRALLDFDRPIGVLMVAVLHFVPDDGEPGRIIADVMAAVPPGSYLVISQIGVARRPLTPEQRAATARYSMANPIALRTRAQVAAFFAGLDLIEPGVVDSSHWRPESDTPPDPAETVLPSHAGVARKPGA
jgi:SAM-dependent methyltransferase